MKFVVVFAALFAVALAENAYPKAQYPSPSYDEKKYDYAPPKPYNYGYDVKDDYYYSNFGHQESSDGKVVSGSYRVALPDGRTQIVTYKADEYGNVADVKYEGEAKPYDYKPAYPAPAYPAPAYPAPAYPTPSYTTTKY